MSNQTNKGITPEKLAQVAAMVAAQKAKLANNQKQQVATVPRAVSAQPLKNVDREKVVAEKKSAKVLERQMKKKELAERRAAKTAEREARKATKASSNDVKVPSYQRKIDKLRSQLPQPTDNLNNLSDVLTRFSDVELTNALQYVEFERRARGLKATGEARENNAIVLNPGDKVRIKNCNARKFIGQVGIVTLVRRIRAFVEIPGFETKAYVFSTDVEVLEIAGVSKQRNNNTVQMGQNILEETGT